ncbi:MFS transporter [Streptomyces sp. NBC_00124]|uniref:MFS transporter n=1 Tax=Streptomyces sp. NBC_00124 TaxID=2975662 RepID=UPI00225B3348|nr:MFS transporter [Streptomyces sp. NBC_00124]MCX5357650.1 MFS transporter [Streptomyces sp. NBC_00124]
MTQTATPRRAAIRRALMSVLPEPGPGRNLYWSTLINSAGNGLFLTTSSLYFVRCVGLTPAEVGLWLTVSGLIGMLAGVPVGRIADRHGPRETYVVSLVAEALATGALLLTRSLVSFVAVTTIAFLAASASSSSRGPLVRAAGGERAAQLRSRLRTAMNLGVTLVGPVAAVAISVDSPLAYQSMIACDALSFAVCALMTLRMPRVPGTKATGTASRRWRVFTDRPYLTLIGINAVIMQQFPVLTLVLPLWISLHTQVPRWVVGLVVPLNTVLVVLLQVRLSQGLESLLSAARVMVRAGLAFLASLALIGFLGHMSAAPATVALMVAIVVYTLGEIWSTASVYELSFGLAPAEAQGEYLGLLSNGAAIGRLTSQALVTTLCLTVGTAGWIVLGLLLLGAGLVAVPTTKWAGRKQAALA